MISHKSLISVVLSR